MYTPPGDQGPALSTARRAGLECCQRQVRHTRPCELDAARERLERLRKLNQDDPHRKAAATDLEKALRNWQQLTGCLPLR